MKASKSIQAYFDRMEKDCKFAYEIAKKARQKGYDPSREPEIRLAKNMAERVIGLISVAVPQIVGGGAEERILELEDQYGAQDWRVGLKLAEEVAQQKFCTFKTKLDAMEAGIRAGFTYVTVGIVSSPLEGFTSLEVRPRRDGKGEYFCLNYSGPIRNAGGTAAAVSVLIADYVRVTFGYATYDPTEQETKRAYAEIIDYHNMITNLQYVPSENEIIFLMNHLPVEVSGDPSEKYEISNVTLKDLPRVSTNRLRSGFCLIHSSCIPLKAPKLWKQLSKWRDEFNLGHWDFLEPFIEIQKKSKAKGKVASTQKISPDFTYVSDLVAGRPVISHPLAQGGLRLRYGRSRLSGFSAQSVHPATMIILDDYLAIGTQLKVERPGKAAAYSTCDQIEGPIVKLKSGEVMLVQDTETARRVNPDVEEILYLGDVLINYGDFLDRAHLLVPNGYCQEEWALEVEEACKKKHGEEFAKDSAASIGLSAAELKNLLDKPMTTPVSLALSMRISKSLDVPLHPAHTPHWNALTVEQLKSLLQSMSEGRMQDDQLTMSADQKRSLELIGYPHHLVDGKTTMDGDAASMWLLVLGARTPGDLAGIADRIAGTHKTSLEAIQSLATVPVRDKSGIFIGARMGRPEKAKMRKLTGSPHTLFPVGDEGGRLRSFQAAMIAGKVTSNFQNYVCPTCKKQTALSVCETCETQCVLTYYCNQCGKVEKCPHDPQPFEYQSIDINHYFRAMLTKLNTRIYPDLIKGVRGTSNKEHVSEHLLKGIIRAQHDVYVNKDGTIRYDCSELTLTHFRPREARVEVAALLELGYTHDMDGQALERDDQILELKPQDILLPCCPTSPDEPADEVLLRASRFVDDLLTKMYGLKPYYALRETSGLVGHYVIGLAPHTSAGILARIVGFSKTQAFLAHPLLHAAMRRDCDGDESCFFLLMDGLLNFSRKYLPSSRGSTMDAPLVLTYILNPAEVDDMVFQLDIVRKYPLELYRAAKEFKAPWEVKIKTIGSVIGEEEQFEHHHFTHDTSDFNEGVLCSAYKTLPSMEEKLKGQMYLAQKIRAVDGRDVARLVIEKHFLRDTKGNLRKYSQQQFRCVNCNEKFRRPPLAGKCTCGGKLIFTISESSIVKYLEPSISLAEKFNVDPYLKETLELTKYRVESVFGRDKEKQTGLGAWFSAPEETAAEPSRTEETEEEAESDLSID
ncbi:MAG: DNA polymerase II large subunit [Nanoarchaeota archaeon]